MIGIGPALRKAREHRGRSLEETARDTMIRPDVLAALEEERFEELPGDVYVRGFLRSYSQYLGLSPDKVLAAYSKEVGSDIPPPILGPVDPGEEEPILRPRQTGSWIVALGIALSVFLLAAALGLLSNAASTPDPAPLPTAIESPEPPTPVSLSLLARARVNASIIVDGKQEFLGVLQELEARDYRKVDEITVSFDRGAVVELKVNGRDLGMPGSPDVPYEATFTGEGTLPGEPVAEVSPVAGESPVAAAPTTRREERQARREDRQSRRQDRKTRGEERTREREEPSPSPSV